jgi:pimeloyl-ACP methyl ester carboxylesterase
LETRAAIEHVLENSNCSQVLLMGHCSGAFIALAAAFDDQRVAGIVAISPEGGDEDWVEFDRKQKEARYYANYYGKSALANSSRWKRLLTGKANYRSIIRNVVRNIIWYRVSALAYRFRSASGRSAKDAGERADVREYKLGLHKLAERRVPILLIHPDQSAGPEMLRALLGDAIEELRTTGAMQTRFIENSDHMFTPLAAQGRLIATIREWALQLVPSRERVSLAEGVR